MILPNPAVRCLPAVHKVKSALLLLFALILIPLLLTGCGGGSNSPTEQANQPPVAHAGADQTVDEKTVVILDGSASHDPDGSIAKYEWKRTAGTTVTLSDANAIKPTFTVPDVSADETIAFELTVTDDKGAAAKDSVNIAVRNIIPSVNLKDATLIYNEPPSLNETATITIDENILGSAAKKNTDIVWSVISQPINVSLALNPSEDGLSINFTPSDTGKYTLQAASGNTSTQTSFEITPDFPFDESKIEGNDGSKPLSQVIGAIKNQVWVYSNTLDRVELETIVSNYNSFNVIGFDDIQGLLIQFNSESSVDFEELENLKLESGINSVVNRFHKGNDVPSYELIPDDGSKFDDGGDNWHLEKIRSTQAWDITTGSDDFYIGISDNGFDNKHEDLKGRFHSLLSSKIDNHGTEVAGSIAALTDNEKGVSGINWGNKLIVGNGSTTENLKAVIEADKKVMLANSSWAIPGYLDNSFDPESQDSINSRDEISWNAGNSARKLTDSHPERFFVWSAGNGIDNGGGNSQGDYGVNGRHHSPALHYGGVNRSLDKAENVIFVAALNDDNRLAYYSNFGEAVDIAAPTGYRSTKINNEYSSTNLYGKNNSGGFVGTSAAAPVVTGVASLIYSLDTSFTGADVKKILISSATETVKERYKSPGDEGIFGGNVEALEHEIPILNAEAAVKLAKEIVDGNIAKVTASFPDPFKSQIFLSYGSASSKFEAIGFSREIEGTKDGKNWLLVAAGESKTGNTEYVDFDPELIALRIKSGAASTVTLKHKETGVGRTASIEFNQEISNVNASTINTVSLSALPNAQITIEPMFLAGSIFKKEGVSDDNGLAKLYLQAGSYKIFTKATGYKDFVTTVNIGKIGQSIPVKLSMTPDSTAKTGSLNGMVLDTSGKPISGAVVRISGSAQTNGFFASAKTDQNGSYQLSNIKKTDQNGNNIISFTLVASAKGSAESVKEKVIILDGKERTENFTLVKKDILPGALIYSTSFEQDEWSATGIWNRVNLTSKIANTLVDNGFCSLPPDENSDRSYLPSAFDGSYAMWYGKAETGSFIVTQASGDSLKSGGTSTSAHSGTITSPEINLVSSIQPVLRFNTWWEIEGVNPNSSGYDLMDVQISVNGGTFQTLRRLNPQVDPNDDDRKHKNFSSGGFNRMPVWVQEELDLSDYAGNTVHLRFSFDTKDSSFNGFRGWLIDNFQVIEGSANDSQVAGKAFYMSSVVTESKQGFFSGLSNDYLRIHKQPTKSVLSEGGLGR